MEATKEKPAVDTASCSKDFEEIAPTSSLLRLLEKFQDWEERFGVEGRGIERVSPNDRIEPSNEALFQILFSWISINTVGNNMVVGMMGPYVYGLSFKDTAWLIVIANMLGALGPFYVAGLGPVSGNRTLVCGVWE